MSEPRWVGQRDEYNCGPIAVANAAKWAGVGFNWKKDWKALRKLCDCVVGQGTTNEGMEKALRATLGKTFRVVRRKSWKIDRVFDHLERRGMVIFAHTVFCPCGHREGHFSAIVDVLGNQPHEWYKAVNFDTQGTTRWIGREEFKRAYKPGRKGDRIWYVGKEGVTKCLG